MDLGANVLLATNVRTSQIQQKKPRQVAGSILLHIGVFPAIKQSENLSDHHRLNDPTGAAADESAKRFQPFHGKGFLYREPWRSLPLPARASGY